MSKRASRVGSFVLPRGARRFVVPYLIVEQVSTFVIWQLSQKFRMNNHYYLRKINTTGNEMNTNRNENIRNIFLLMYLSKKNLASRPTSLSYQSDVSRMINITNPNIQIR